ncbi:ABC transporter G family member 7 [Gracilariopsis chorda]|uniref:Probable ATP-dependent transporter ycf16 n=1 Tax=Gracilariopsis chorda TaxID=448386 RepID=A0A2V3IXE2_9FLOR|nr:ABC transporter G family member 7 [Gracilariopsis chorda]|eukprot:PXF46733.1 ABC transporter G family member 7 [Gracilariopsis chorda]
MLLAVGGLMVTLAFPGRAVPTLLFTAAVNTVRVIRHARKKPKPANQATVTAADRPVTVEWSNVTCKLSASKSSKEKIILEGVSGVATPGRVLAILGPSGSGKTTLLNTLAGRLPASSKIHLFGHVTRNGVPVDHDDQPVAYVTQDDLFFSQLTVRETLHIAAQMTLPANMSTDDKHRFADALIRKLGLLSTVNTRVGDEKSRGISGGEKKRLSLACELISTPKLILCDEPTSGLDAFQAAKVMASLRDLAQAGHTVICSIHQPSSSIFNMCDDIVLLAGGRVAYAGATADAPAHFENLGYPMPERCNPAERYLDLISVDFSSSETVAESNSRIDKLLSAFHRHVPTRGSKHDTDDEVQKVKSIQQAPSRLGMFGKVRLLFQRAWKQVTRDKKTNISRFMSSFMSALLFGAIYWRIGNTQTTIQDRLGLLQVCTINTAMTALVKTLNVFSKESVLVNRERVRGSYGVAQYFISKLLAEMPVSAFFPLVFSMTVYPMVRLSSGLGKILRFIGIVTLESFTAASYGLFIGALMPSTEAALAVGPSSFVLQIVFGGLYVTDENVPGWASWIPRISLIKHAYEGLCVNEFRGLEFQAERPYDVKTGDQVLQRMTWEDSTVLKTCISQARVLVFNYLATFAILTLKKPRFEKLQHGNDIDDEEESAVIIEADDLPNGQLSAADATSKAGA